MRGHLRLDAESVDIALMRYLGDLCYVKGAGFQAAAKTYSGMTHLAPKLRDKLPRAARALISWQRLDNPAEGGPVPEEVLALLALYLFKQHKWDHGIIVLLSYEACLRKIDWETITNADVLVEERGQDTPQGRLAPGHEVPWPLD